MKYALQTNVTLFNPLTSFFGRTYRGKLLPLRIDQQMLSTDGTDWCALYTRSEALETKAVVEVVIVETDVLSGTSRTRGVGYAVVPLFYDQMPKQVQVLQGSPRDILKHLGDTGFEPPKTDSVLEFEVSMLGKDAKQLQWLMGLLPDNTLVG